RDASPDFVKMPENEYHNPTGEKSRPEDAGTVRTERLDLVPMAPAVLRALLAGNRAGAAVLLGATLPDEWEAHADVLEIRLRQLTNDPALQPWLLRAMVLRETGEAVGGIGFHDAPRRRRRDDPTAGSAEAGYWVSGSRRRQGLASEAFLAPMRWARHVHGVRRFVVSV